MHWSAAQSHDPVVKVLLEAGANIEAKDDVRWTPLDYAKRGGHTGCVALLEEAAKKAKVL